MYDATGIQSKCNIGIFDEKKKYNCFKRFFSAIIIKCRSILLFVNRYHILFTHYVNSGTPGVFRSLYGVFTILTGYIIFPTYTIVDI